MEYHTIYTKDLINQIKQTVDIVEFINGFIELNKKGNYWFAVCPFHGDSNPSLAVNQEKNSWHCYGCQRGGDIISFVREYNSCSFSEAIEFLASRLNIKLPDKQYYDPNYQLYQILQIVNEDFQQLLKRCTDAKDYLQKRNITEQAIENFGVGYAPYVKTGYLPVKYKDYLSLLKDSGLIREKDGQIVEIFKRRIIFPILDDLNHIVGMTARTIETNSKYPKYINSPETEIFHKGKLFYHVKDCIDYIKQLKCAIIVEGPTDVIALHQCGINNVLSILGSAFTEYHVKKLLSYTKSVILMTDGDEAGIKASIEAVKLLLPNQVNLSVVQLPEKHDPDSYIKSGNEIAKLINNPCNAIDWLNSLYVSMKSVNDKYNFVHSVIDSTYNAIDPLYGNEIRNELIKRFEIDYKAIKRPLPRKRSNVVSNVQLHQSEIKLFKFMLANRQTLEFVIARLSPSIFITKNAEELFAILKSGCTEISHVHQSLFDYINSSNGISYSFNEKEIMKVVLRLKIDSVTEKLNDLKLQLEIDSVAQAEQLRVKLIKRYKEMCTNLGTY